MEAGVCRCVFAWRGGEIKLGDFIGQGSIRMLVVMMYARSGCCVVACFIGESLSLSLCVCVCVCVCVCMYVCVCVSHQTTSPTLEEMRYLMNCFMLLYLWRKCVCVGLCVCVCGCLCVCGGVS